MLAAFGMRDSGRRALLIAVVAVLVLSPLAELAKNVYLLNPWWWRGGHMPDASTYAVQAIISIPMSAVLPLLLALFLRRPEVRSLFR